MAQHSIDFVDINPGANGAVATFAADPLSIKFEPLSTIEDPLKLEDCSQDPLQLEDLNSDTECQTGIDEDPFVTLTFVSPNGSWYFYNPGEETEETDFGFEIDTLSINLDNPLKTEDPVYQEDSGWNLLEQKLGLDTRSQTGYAEDPFEKLVDLIQDQLAKHGRAGKGTGHVSNVLDPLDQKDSGWNPLEQKLDLDTRSQTGYAEDPFEKLVDLIQDQLAKHGCAGKGTGHVRNALDPLDQKDSGWNPLEQKLDLDTRSQTGYAEDPFEKLVDLIQDQLAKHGCAGKGTGHVRNALQGKNYHKHFSSAASTQSSVACNNVFGDVLSLKSHEKKVHGALKPSATLKQVKSSGPPDFECDECERSFTSVYFLSRHKVNCHQTGDTTDAQRTVDSRGNQLASRRKKIKNFRCNKSEKLFSNKFDLLNHKIKQHQSSKAQEIPATLKTEFLRPSYLRPRKRSYVSCCRCDKSFKIACHLRFHQLAVHQDVMCSQCGMTFIKSNDRTIHTNQYHPGTEKKQKYKCKICPKKTPERLFNSNIREITSSHIKSFSCFVCDKTFPSRFSRNEHLVRHPGQARVTCTICGTPFIDIIELTLHKFWHTYHLQHSPLSKYPPRRRYDCELCLKIFSSNSALSEHAQMHIDEKIDKEEVQCYYCPDVLMNISLYRNHMIDNHKGQPIQCYICAKVFTTNKWLQIHVREHSDIKSGQSYKCPICLKNYISRLSLKGHMKVHSRSKKQLGDCTVQCHLCSKTVPVPILARQAHQQTRVRTGPKPFTCDSCGQMLSRKSVIKNHKAIHTPVLRIKCTLCRSTFNKPTGLRYHMRIHSKELKRKCEMCGMSFAEEVQLTLHKLKQHKIESTVPIPEMENMEKIYKCSFCPKVCTHLWKLNMHLRASHDFDPNNVYVCDVCGNVFEKKNDLKMHWVKHITNLQEANGRFFFELETETAIHSQGDADRIVGTSASVGIVQMDDIVQLEKSYFVAPIQSSETLPNSPTDVTENDSSCVQSNILPKTVLSNVQTGSQNDPHGKKVLDATALAMSNIQPLAQKSSQNTPRCSQIMPPSTKCMICHEDFLTKTKLISHYESHCKLKLSHKDAELFKKRLKTHGIGSYSCHDCKKKFFVHDKFKKHRAAQVFNSFGRLSCIPKVVHRKTLQMPLPCTICGKVLSHQSALTSHIQAHVREDLETCEAIKANHKIYKCSVCNAAFAVKHKCTAHERLHVEKNTNNPRNC